MLDRLHRPLHHQAVHVFRRAAERGDGERLAETFARELGLHANDLEKLQELPVEAILTAQHRTVLALQGEARRLTFSPGLDRPKQSVQ